MAGNFERCEMVGNRRHGVKQTPHRPDNMVIGYVGLCGTEEGTRTLFKTRKKGAWNVQEDPRLSRRPDDGAADGSQSARDPCSPQSRTRAVCSSQSPRPCTYVDRARGVDGTGGTVVAGRSRQDGKAGYAGVTSLHRRHDTEPGKYFGLGILRGKPQERKLTHTILPEKLPKDNFTHNLRTSKCMVKPINLPEEALRDRIGKSRYHIWGAGLGLRKVDNPHSRPPIDSDLIQYNRFFLKKNDPEHADLTQIGKRVPSFEGQESLWLKHESPDNPMYEEVGKKDGRLGKPLSQAHSEYHAHSKLLLWQPGGSNVDVQAPAGVRTGVCHHMLPLASQEATSALNPDGSRSPRRNAFRETRTKGSTKGWFNESGGATKLNRRDLDMELRSVPQEYSGVEYNVGHLASGVPRTCDVLQSGIDSSWYLTPEPTPRAREHSDNGRQRSASQEPTRFSTGHVAKGENICIKGENRDLDVWPDESITSNERHMRGNRKANQGYRDLAVRNNGTNQKQTRNRSGSSSVGGTPVQTPREMRTLHPREMQTWQDQLGSLSPGVSPRQTPWAQTPRVRPNVPDPRLSPNQDYRDIAIHRNGTSGKHARRGKSGSASVGASPMQTPRDLRPGVPELIEDVVNAPYAGVRLLPKPGSKGGRDENLHAFDYRQEVDKSAMPFVSQAGNTWGRSAKDKVAPSLGQSPVHAHQEPLDAPMGEPAKNKVAPSPRQTPMQSYREPYEPEPLPTPRETNVHQSPKPYSRDAILSQPTNLEGFKGDVAYGVSPKMTPRKVMEDSVNIWSHSPRQTPRVLKEPEPL